jgi:hypothetical protein
MSTALKAHHIKPAGMAAVILSLFAKDLAYSPRGSIKAQDLNAPDPSSILMLHDHFPDAASLA